jgi:hypothetical protein
MSPRLEHLVCDLTREGIPLSDVARGLGLRDQAISNALYLGQHGGPARYVRFAEGIEDARRERQAIIADLLASARAQLHG